MTWPHHSTDSRSGLTFTFWAASAIISLVLIPSRKLTLNFFPSNVQHTNCNWVPVRAAMLQTVGGFQCTPEARELKQENSDLISLQVSSGGDRV